MPSPSSRCPIGTGLSRSAGRGTKAKPSPSPRSATPLPQGEEQEAPLHDPPLRSPSLSRRAVTSPPSRGRQRGSGQRPYGFGSPRGEALGRSGRSPDSSG